MRFWDLFSSSCGLWSLAVALQSVRSWHMDSTAFRWTKNPKAESLRCQRTPWKRRRSWAQFQLLFWQPWKEPLNVLDIRRRKRKKIPWIQISSLGQRIGHKTPSSRVPCWKERWRWEEACDCTGYTKKHLKKVHWWSLVKWTSNETSCHLLLLFGANWCLFCKQLPWHRPASH